MEGFTEGIGEIYLKRGRQHTSEFYAKLKDIIEMELKENPYTQFSYYSLSRHISREHKPVGSYCIQVRVAKLVKEGKVEVMTDPIKKSRKRIRWIKNA